VAERLADRIGIIADGRLRALGSLADLRETGGGGLSRETLEDVFLRLVGRSARTALQGEAPSATAAWAEGGA
jgi:ABC-2 type transport system ATP-binding protein